MRVFFSSKYESGMCLGNCPHLLIFANFKPDLSNMSLDRWVVKNLGRESESCCVSGGTDSESD